MKIAPSIKVMSIEQAGDSHRIKFIASHEGYSVVCEINSTAPLDERQKVLERHGRDRLRDYLGQD